jgi:hypothetical protein
MKLSRMIVTYAIVSIGLLLGPLAVAQTPNTQDQNAPQATPPANPQNSQENTVPSQNPPDQQMQNNAQQPIVLVDPGKIYNEDPTSWVGKRIELQNVMVEEADKAGNFWVGSDKNHRLLIVKSKNNPNLMAKEFHKGDIVTIDGTIHPAGDIEAQETNAAGGKMKKARETSGVFLLADDVNIASSTQHK